MLIISKYLVAICRKYIATEFIEQWNNIICIDIQACVFVLVCLFHVFFNQIYQIKGCQFIIS